MEFYFISILKHLNFTFQNFNIKIMKFYFAQYFKNKNFISQNFIHITFVISNKIN